MYYHYHRYETVIARITLSIILICMFYRIAACASYFFRISWGHYPWRTMDGSDAGLFDKHRNGVSVNHSSDAHCEWSYHDNHNANETTVIFETFSLLGSTHILNISWPILSIFSGMSRVRTVRMIIALNPRGFRRYIFSLNYKNPRRNKQWLAHT